MSEPDEIDEPPKKKSKLPLVLGVFLALALGGGGFYASYSGMLGGASKTAAASKDSHPEPVPLDDVAFVSIEPLLITLGGDGPQRHLRFRAELEITPGEESNVTALMPRVLDVLNGYLRAVEITELEKPTALIRMRAQMLRRIQLVVGDGRVRDLLVTEFVLS